MEHKLVVVLISASTLPEAERLAEALLAARLTACASILPGVSSSYWWHGNIESAHEAFLLVKSRTVLLDEITKCVMAHHSYEVPEIIALPIVGGNADYLEWVADETKQR